MTDGSEARFFSAPDGRRLAYFDEGAGPPVLCLAGLTRNHRDFADLAAHLSDRYRVLRLDCRGRGLSERAEAPIDEYSPEVEAGDALALLDHLGLSGVAIVGTSRGGILGMAMAAGRPDSVRALVLNDVGAVVEGRGLLRISSYVGRQPEARSFEEAARQLREANQHQFVGVTEDGWLRHARAIYDDADGRPVLSYDPQIRQALVTEFDPDEGVQLWPFFDAIRGLPVLVLRGERSDVLSDRTVAEMERRHPGLVSVTVHGRGHAPFLTEPEAEAAIDEFLARTMRADPADAPPEEPPARAGAKTESA